MKPGRKGRSVALYSEMRVVEKFNVLSDFCQIIPYWAVAVSETAAVFTRKFLVEARSLDPSQRWLCGPGEGNDKRQPTTDKLFLTWAALPPETGT